MTALAAGVLALALLAILYPYALYPAILWVLARLRPRRAVAAPGTSWPPVTIVVPVYNEAANIADCLERILDLDYPADRLQVVVVSDASTDQTDAIVRSYAGRGVTLVRLPKRAGKTAAENAALPHLRGSLVVNTDASVRLPANALKPLIAAFEDESVGVASGRDVSVAALDGGANLGESDYVSYEMWVRRLETGVHGIVGASGCFYACRVALHRELVPTALSRDFAAPLIAREQGFRAVSVDEAVCLVPRTRDVRREFRRKVRTMTRGLATLFYKRNLLDPRRFGLFAWMLFSHKLARWLVPWAVVAACLSVAVLAARIPALPLGAAAGIVVAGVALGALGWVWPTGRRLPRPIAALTYFVLGTLAALLAWFKAVRGDMNPIWEPTRR